MTTLEELQDLIHKKYGVDPATLDPNASMRGAGIDSLTLVEYLFAVEDHYGISVPEKYSDVDTLADLARAVDKIRAEKEAKAAGSSAAKPTAEAQVPASSTTDG